MTYYEDMSPYMYFPDSVPPGINALSVGWLEAGPSHPTGTVPADFLHNLAELVDHEAQMQTRGLHSCTLTADSESCGYPVTVNIRGSEQFLGGAELRVIAESGDWLIAPDLIYHYVAKHSYMPPQVFIEAVNAQRVAPLTDVS
ncbi:hypothetical protein ABZZ79_39080 [Streptomyces sp. NPDC006458]|uniref:DUF7919 family protein n=1 Tax=Streptomyces sp. NPDC006458 TaxID=3154302 RepID=UPI0033AAC9A7